MQLILGTLNSANVNLIAQLLMIAALWVGSYFAHTQQIAKHRQVQTTVVLVNIFFIAFIMVTSLYSYVILGGTATGTVAWLMIIHGALGLVAELTGIYLVLRMRTHLIPPRFRVRNFKLLMRSLLGLWTLVVVLGFGIYYFRYLPAPAVAVVSPVAHLNNEADAIALHAEELVAARDRGNLATARRHAEHVVNLIEGKSGADYGDLDHDGIVQDPGDGVGALIYLRQVRDSAAVTPAAAQVAAVADQVEAAMVKIVADAKSVLRSDNLNAIAAPAAEIKTLAAQIKDGTSNGVPQIARLLGASVALPTAAPAVSGSTPNTITVNMRDFQFSPKTVTVSVGTTVVFVNLDNAKHTATADDGQFNSKDILPGTEFSFTFTRAGFYPFHCEYHGDKGGVDMAGTIVVQ